MNTQNNTIIPPDCIIIDSPDKVDLLREFPNKKGFSYKAFSCFAKAKSYFLPRKKTRILMLGGNLGSKVASKFVLYLKQNDLLRKDAFYVISTWDTDEARFIRALLQGYESFYMPFNSKTLDFVSKKAKYMREKELKKINSDAQN